MTNTSPLVTCPRCGGTQITANRQGFGVGKAVVGVFTLGALGLLGGTINNNRVKVTCLNCGHSWIAGSPASRRATTPPPPPANLPASFSLSVLGIVFAIVAGLMLYFMR